MIFIKNAVLLSDNADNPIIAEGSEAMKKNGFHEDDIAFYMERLVSILNDYARELGENTEIRYYFRKRFSRMEAQLLISGEAYDPFENGAGARTRKIEKDLNLNLFSQKTNIAYHYVAHCNVLTISVPLHTKRKSLLKDPMIWAVFLGVLAGIVCLHLPENAGNFIINDVMTPVQSVVLKLISGIMGPVIFVSLASSIIALDSVNELTDMGFKIFRRFFRIIVFVLAISIGVSLLFFANFGEGGFEFEPTQIISMLLNIVPVNLFSPFLENNTPQLVVLALMTGVALLLLGDSVKELNNLLKDTNQWIMKVMELVLRILPLIPFLSIAIIVAKGNVAELLEGWKFIAASYIVFTIIFVYKLIKAAVKTQIPVRKLLLTVKPLMLLAFTTGSSSAPVRLAYEVSKNELKIKPEFTSFWIPMCSAMLGVKTTINLVLATMMTAHLCGIPISYSFLFVLTILVLELSLASPGSTAGWVIMFDAFSMPASYTGLFSTYRLFTDNYASAVITAFDLFEELEAAYQMDAIVQEQGSSI